MTLVDSDSSFMLWFHRLVLIAATTLTNDRSIQDPLKGCKILPDTRCQVFVGRITILEREIMPCDTRTGWPASHAKHCLRFSECLISADI